MSTTIEFYFDFGSPMAYLAHKRFDYLREKYDVNIEYRPMLLGGVHKATKNQPPAAIPVKGMYLLKHDVPRFVKRYQVPFKMNPHFPVNTLPLMRGCFAAEKLGVAEAYNNVMFDALWNQGLNMADPEVIKQVLLDNDLPADELLAATQDPAVKQQLIDATEAAVKRNCFGAPTMFVEGEMFFGQDRLDFVEEILQQG
ncbi:2-hydroxychromene-2-carboxylate isomerase [Bacterioplanoides sp. SCSIO 12839]|uniref:2-hydroxychromene-2-carboxylate isomerase n=1 Tax=Bacterioplanoides sp. SCSIO 12839 TaxID=2829569 RepID=UPI0021066754|nr:2-hydroxychromene-2-carboxylate isomerase [Bacterioplanoides sp. SCSIO 12839]UTW48863.1 2-hydroxychromene-2-carboxylate isomerase [Bacterioplanoides sp. SCSIO 12839]